MSVKHFGNLVEGKIVNAKENGCLLEGEIDRIYNDSVDLTDVIMWNKDGSDFSRRDNCNVFFEQLC